MEKACWLNYCRKAQAPSISLVVFGSSMLPQLPASKSNSLGSDGDYKRNGTEKSCQYKSNHTIYFAA